MTTAVIVLSLALAGALVVVALLVRAVLGFVPDQRASFGAEVLAGKAQMAAELAQRGAEVEKEKAEQQRDEEKAARVKAEAERDQANAALVDSQRALNKLIEENGHAAVTKIRSAPNSDAARDALIELLKATGAAEAVPDGASSGPRPPFSGDLGGA